MMYKPLEKMCNKRYVNTHYNYVSPRRGVGTYCFCNGVRLPVCPSVCLSVCAMILVNEKNCNFYIFKILIIKLLKICRFAPGILFVNGLNKPFSAIDIEFAPKIAFTENLLAGFV